MARDHQYQWKEHHMTTTNRRRKRDWSEHDAQIPFRCPVMVRRNGTNKAGRRPHSLMEPQRLQAANDNSDKKLDK